MEVYKTIKLRMINKQERLKIITTSGELHSLVETSYLNHPAKKNDNEWL